MSTDAQKNNNEPVRLPLFSTIFGAYGLILDKFKHFALLGTIFAVIMMLFYTISGQDTFCYNRLYRESHFCNNNLALFIAVHLLNIFIVCMFLRTWAQVVLEGNQQTWRQIFTPRLSDLKIAGGFVISFLTLAITAGSFFLLAVRIPNPDWRIEWAYFTIVSIGFFSPLIALRFLVYFVFIATEKKFPSPFEIWRKTKGSGIALLGGIVFLTMISLFLAQALLGNSIRAGNSSLFAAIVNEFLSDLAVIFVAACFMNYCYLQKTFLFRKDENEKSDNT